METQTTDPTVTTETSAEQSAAEQSIDLEAIKAEVESIDPGALADTDDKRTLFRYVRRRQQLVSEGQRIADQLEAMLRDLKNKVAGLDYVYEGLAADITKKLLAGGKSKSIKTPFGTVGFRSSAARLYVVKDAEVIAAVNAGKLPGEVIRTKIEIAMAPLSDRFKSDGEIPPGCDVAPAAEKFYVK